MRGYMGKRHEHAGTDAGVHVTDHIFRGSHLDESDAAVSGATPPARDLDLVGRGPGAHG